MKDKDPNQIIDFQEKLIERYIENKRPPLELRDQVDLGYTYEDHVVELFEIRPQWNDDTKKIKSSFAKSKYVKSKKIWKVYWMRASGKWQLYEPGEVKNLSEFLAIVEADKLGCFWG